MTLLVDRLRSDRRWSSDRLGEDIDLEVAQWLFEHVPPIYEISNVADYLAESGTDFTKMEHFPNVAPPHIQYWMEWRAPTKLVPMLGDGCLGPERVGLLVWQEAPPENGTWMVGCHAWGMWKRDHRAEPLVSWQLRMDAGGFPEIVSSHIYDDIARLFERGQRVTPVAGTVELPLIESIEHARRLHAEAVRKKEEATRLRDEAIAKLDEVWSDWVRYAVLHPALMAHSLLACKNVAVDSNRPPARLSRRHRRETGRALVTFRTLRVAPVGHKTPGPSGEATGIHPALHIVRGHFKTFTADRPLFGRLVGTYWWASTLRGSPEQGVVIKEYAISGRIDAGADQEGRE